MPLTGVECMIPITRLPRGSMNAQLSNPVPASAVKEDVRTAS